jgi:uncharacterized membrane protein
MSAWKYSKNGQSCGPVETDELKSLITSGQLPPDTLVWKEGMPNWIAAGTLPEFTGLVPAVPPPPTSGAGPMTGFQSSEPPVPGALSDAADIEKNKIFAILAYLSILFLVPLLAAPQSKFARYHTNQGLLLFLASLGACIVAAIATFILSFIPFVGCIGVILVPAVGLGSLVLTVLGIINAANGQCKPLPLIGQFTLLK